MALVSPINRGVPPARPGEFAPLRLEVRGPGSGPAIELTTPVVLAPMAGVTNPPYRVLCRRFGEALFVSEMITARGLVAGNAKTWSMTRFHPEERPRALQLYATDEATVEEAARRLVGERDVELLDLNLGCPVRKITSNGGGAAIPLRPRLLARIVAGLRRGAPNIPITVKMRLGIDGDHLSYLEAGKIAENEGVAAVGLHARTAAELYSGHADWPRIGELQSALSVPVLGNGDVFEAYDALRMMRSTGCRGVIIGRGCLGRPWLFGELEAVFAGREPDEPPTFGRIREIALEHARLLIDFVGEKHGILQMRKFSSWYTKSYPGTATLRERLFQVSTLSELADALAEIPPDTRYPITGLRARRCKSSRRQDSIALPQGFLHRDDASP